MTTTVAVVRCPDYELNRVAAAVTEALDLLGGASRFFSRGLTVLVKPNVMGPFPPDSGMVTHPSVAEVIIQTAQRNGCAVKVGDSPAGVSDAQALDLAWRESGYASLTDRTGARRAVFEAAVTGCDPLASVGIDRHYLAEDALTADLVVNCPKLKTHRLMRYTGAVKNMMGVIPGSRKAHIHRLNPAPEFVAGVIADVLAIIKPGLTILDAVDVLEGDGPGSAGSLRRLGLLVAGVDPVAVDVTACRIVGIEPMSVPTTAVAAARGLGSFSPETIAVAGVDLPEVSIGDFLQAPSGRWDSTSAFVRRFWELARTKVRIDNSLCGSCNRCVAACPVGAIYASGGKMYVLEDCCIECYCCHEVCPVAAIIIERTYKRL